jgi:hypothetical protein
MKKREYLKPAIGLKLMYEEAALLNETSETTIPFEDDDEEEFHGGGDAKPAHFSVWED